MTVKGWDRMGHPIGVCPFLSRPSPPDKTGTCPFLSHSVPAWRCLRRIAGSRPHGGGSPQIWGVLRRVPASPANSRTCNTENVLLPPGGRSKAWIRSASRPTTPLAHARPQLDRKVSGGAACIKSCRPSPRTGVPLTRRFFSGRGIQTGARQCLRPFGRYAVRTRYASGAGLRKTAHPSGEDRRRSKTRIFAD